MSGHYDLTVRLNGNRISPVGACGHVGGCLALCAEFRMQSAINIVTSYCEDKAMQSIIGPARDYNSTIWKGGNGSRFIGAPKKIRQDFAIRTKG